MEPESILTKTKIEAAEEKDIKNLVSDLNETLKKKSLSEERIYKRLQTLSTILIITLPIVSIFCV